MALTGTLKDFSVTDIFQLIGQQSKSGVLHLRSSSGEEIHISFHQGAVVGAEHVSRRHRDLLGRMLVRARLIDEKQLADALELQKRTLRRLGDILVEEGAISRELLREMTQLQITETLGALFYWKRGSYEFEAKPVIWDEDSITPLRSEAVLMDGFRMVDEWPLVRKKIVSPKSTFEVLEALPPPEPPAPADETSFADLLEEDDGGIGPSERRVMELIEPGRTVEELVDLARLGTFETWKALANLVEMGHLRLVVPATPERTLEADEKQRPWIGGSLSVLVYTAIALFLWLGVVGLVLSHRGEATEALRHAVGGAVEAVQLERVRLGVEVFRAKVGRLPASAEELVKAGLLGVEEAALHWQNVADSVVLPLSIQEISDTGEEEAF